MKIYQVNTSYDGDYAYDTTTDVFFTEEDARDYVESSISKIKEDYERNYDLEGARCIDFWDFTIIVINRDYSTEVIDTVEISADDMEKVLKMEEEYSAYAE